MVLKCGHRFDLRIEQRISLPTIMYCYKLILVYIAPQVAVIDEIQMVKDYQRGWAWTRALLGVPAEEVHVCGEVNLIRVL